jgi:quinol monooxygenase YgiN
MYARVTTLLVGNDKLEELAALLHNDLIPEARKQAGFGNVKLLTDARTGTCILVSFWETEAAMTASRDNGFFDTQMAKLKHLSYGHPVPHHYYVTIDE